MSHKVRFISGVFTTIPSIIFAVYLLSLSKNDYYWITYALMSIIYIGSSIFFGLFLPHLFNHSRLNRSWIMIIIGGSLAWMIGLISLALFNNTPFCVGIDNGDGTSTFALCSLYTVAAAAAYSPGIFVMLIICALIGDKSASALLGMSIDRQ